MHTLYSGFSQNTPIHTHTHTYTDTRSRAQRFSPAGMFVLAFLPAPNPILEDKLRESRFLLKYVLQRLKTFFEGASSNPYMSCICPVYVLYMSCICPVYVLCMSCTYVLCMSYICPIYVLYMSYICPVYVLCMSCICPVYVLYMSCICPMCRSGTCVLCVH